MLYNVCMRALNKRNKIVLAVQIILAIIIIVTLINQIIISHWPNIILCIASLILFLLPDLLFKFKINIPALLEGSYYLFIFATLILGEVFTFYGFFPFWDIVLHLLSGFVCAGVGFAIVGFMNKTKLPVAFVIIFVFCFSMTAGVMWEFCEFVSDETIRTDAQKDMVVNNVSTMTMHAYGSNQPRRIDKIEKTEMFLKDGEVVTVENGYLDIGLLDTMKDLFMNSVGALLFCLMVLFSLKHSDKSKLIDKFVPSKNKVPK